MKRIGLTPIGLVMAPTTQWGPKFWAFLHEFAANYPCHPTFEDQENARTLVHAFRLGLPCCECRGHFGQMILDNPPNVDSRENLARWACDVHNSVNERLGKPIVPFEDVAPKNCDTPTDVCRAESGDSPSSCIWMFVIIVLAALLVSGFLLTRRYSRR